MGVEGEVQCCLAVCAVCRLATQGAAIVASSYEIKKCAHGVFGQLAKCTPQRRCLATITDVTRQRGPRCKSGSSTHGRLRAASRPSGEMRNAPVSSGRCQDKNFWYTSRFVRVILAQGPCESSLYRSNFTRCSPKGIQHLL